LKLADKRYLISLVDLTWKSCLDQDTTALDDRMSDILSISFGHLNVSSDRATTTLSVLTNWIGLPAKYHSYPQRKSFFNVSKCIIINFSCIGQGYSVPRVPIVGFKSGSFAIRNKEEKK